ncbi:MAG: hypothetical protein ACPGWR_00955 [Ardenticatenaceae bacterium]
MITVKALTNWELEVLGAPFGGPFDGKDSQGDYFSTETNFHFDKFALPPLVYYHGLVDTAPYYIGKTLSREVKSDGVWYRARLNPSSEYASLIWQAAQNGEAAASSGSAPHLVRKAPDGLIQEWPIVELSLLETSTGKRPVNSYAVAIPATKGIYKAAGLAWPEERKVMSSERTVEVADQQITQIVDQRVAAVFRRRETEQRVAQERQAEIDAAVEIAVKAEREKADREAAVGRRLPASSTPYVMRYPDVAEYDDHDISTLAFTIGVLSAARQGGFSLGPREQALKALGVRILGSKEDEHLKVRARRVMRSIGLPIKADELNRTNLASYGKEWISETYSTALWENIRHEARIAAMIPTIIVPQGSDSIHIPLEGTPPRFYTVAQASDQTGNPGRVKPTFKTSKVGTGRRTVSVGKMGAAANYTGELIEDSFIMWAAQLRRQLEEEGGQVFDHVCLDGDTDLTASNINLKGATPSDEDFTLFNGLRRLPLKINSANKLKVNDFDMKTPLALVKMLGVRGKNAIDKQKVALIPDLSVHWQMLEAEEVLTRQTYAHPTIEGGNITSLYGYPVIPTVNMHRSNQDSVYGGCATDDGYVSSTAADNMYAAMLAVRWDQWLLAWKRRITIEVQRDPLSDSTVIVLSLRAGMVNRDAEGSALVYGMKTELVPTP